LRVFVYKFYNGGQRRSDKCLIRRHLQLGFTFAVTKQASSVWSAMNEAAVL